MATITPQTTSAAAALTFASASGGGDSLAGNCSGVKLLVNNAAGSPVTVTLTGQVPCNQGSTHNVTQSCTNGQTTEIPIPAQCVDANGNCAVGYSSATSVTVAAISN